MSDMEEPPTKVLKMVEDAPASADSTFESAEDAQEEWLSEGVLTDDDFMPAQTDQTSNLDSSQDTTMPTIDHVESMATDSQDNIDLKPETDVKENIEETLNNFENAIQQESQDFEEFLKKDVVEKKESDLEQSEKQSDDDGHDTDDLLRMLGGDEQKLKKKVLTMRGQARDDNSSDDDDDYIFESAKVTRLKVAKNAVIRKQATKAVPEDLSDRESDNEAATMKSIFHQKRPSNVASKSTGKSSVLAQKNRQVMQVKTEKPSVRQYVNKSKSLLKAGSGSAAGSGSVKREPEELIDEEFLEDEDFDLDDDMGDGSEFNSDPDESVLIHRPETMDEEPPSDEDSRDEDSLYDDVLPSSDSEEIDDWFSLDIRAERAGDYLPWLGDKASEMLSEEKHRVAARLAALRQSVAALQSSGRVLADQIKVATDAIRELDAMLAAA